MLFNQIRGFFNSQHSYSEVSVKTPYFNFPLKSVDTNSIFKIVTCGLNSNSFIKNKNLRCLIPFIYRSIHNSVFSLFNSKVNINIQHYAKKFLHSKSIILKNENLTLLIIGSSNFNHRSFERDIETDFLLVNPPRQLLDYCSQDRDKTLKLVKRELHFIDKFTLLFRKYF